jgi:predicted SprT family Zn-dependent metalloprotease
MKPAEAITPAQYRAFQDAYDFFNKELFAGSLRHVLVTLQRHAHTRGYFAAERFSGRTEQTTAHELAMNPDTFMGRSDREICSTLAHEMVHVWQQAHGTPPRKAYHDKQWSAKMKEIGLYPSSTGEPGGKEVGAKMTHYIVAGGKYDQAFAKLAARGFALSWQSLPWGKERKAKKASKTKFTCPVCAQNVWGKPEAQVVCGVCLEEDAEIIIMLAEEQAEAEAA